MAAIFRNITFKQGTDYRLRLTLQSGGLPVDLVAATVRGSLSRSYTDTQTVEFAVTVDDPASGVALLELDNATTAAMTAGNWVYEIELVDSSTRVLPIAEGKALVRPEVPENAP